MRTLQRRLVRFAAAAVSEIKRKSFTFIFVFVVAALGLTISTARAAILTVDGSGQLTGATNVDLGSLGFFNVSFVDRSCIDLFTGCDAVSDFDFDNPTDATTAAQALLDQVFVDNHISAPTFLFDSIPSLTNGCDDIYQCFTMIPFNFLSAGSIDPMAAFNSQNNAIDATASVAILTSTDTLILDEFNFADFSPLTPVPLPPAVLLFVSALVGLAGLARRQRQA